MTILHRYLVRLMLVNTAVVLAVFFALFVAIDFVADMDEFTQAARAHAGAWGGTVPAFFAVFADYYGPMCLMLFTHLAGVSVAVAAGFTAIHLQRNRELVGVVSSGVSLRRLMAPVLMVALGLNLLVMPVQEWLLPPLAAKAVRSKSELKAQAVRTRGLYMIPDGNGWLLTASTFVPADGRIEGFHALHRLPGGRLERLDAPAARWDGAGWVLEPAGTRLVLDGDNQIASPARRLDTPLRPEVLRVRQNARFGNLLTVGELRSLSVNPALTPSARTGFRRAVAERLLGPWMNAMLVLLTLPWFLTRVPHLQMLRGMASVGCTLLGRALILLGPMALPAFPEASVGLVLALLVAGAGVLVWRMET